MDDHQTYSFSDTTEMCKILEEGTRSGEPSEILINYKCSFCNKILSSKQNLREHVYIHTGEKPYICREKGCGLAFRQGSQLSAHKRIHSAIKTYCNKRKEKNYLKVIAT
ncbi:unnamed protein product [Blepharisma stoltei]|uniref:C2H2-type domain-containing protein n=1 Tax=Blepharisma stoltei TaxID=1481888 RepID=A0AAU9IG85_9CILI|nr:unnamed protein product [Blepharisma stoltei]